VSSPRSVGGPLAAGAEHPFPLGLSRPVSVPKGAIPGIWTFKDHANEESTPGPTQCCVDAPEALS